MARKRTLAEKALNASLTPPEEDERRGPDEYPTRGGFVGKKVRAGRGRPAKSRGPRVVREVERAESESRAVSSDVPASARALPAPSRARRVGRRGGRGR